MLGSNLQKIGAENRRAFGEYRLILAAFLLAGFVVSTFSVLSGANSSQAQIAASLPQTPVAPTIFRVGEKLTYNVSFNKFDNAAYAEIYAASRGKLGEKDAVEIRSKIKTVDLLNSAFYAVDETRTTFASAETGLPLYIRRASNASGLPKQTVYNYLVNPAAANDLLTLLYQVRNAGGVGVFAFQEDDKTYSIVLQNTVGEHVRTDAGEFDTIISDAQSPYFTERGIMNLRINFTADERRVPVLIRFKTAKGDFRAALASLQNVEPEGAPIQTAPPPPIVAVQPARTPTPAPMPTPYIDNQPLSADLAFALGETLEYQVSLLGKYLGNATLQAKERKQFNGQDSLLLTATASETQAGNPLFNLNDGIRAQVNPDSLAPQQIELKFTAGGNNAYNQIAQFDQKNGVVTFNGDASRASVPVGTHSLLSLAYAIRSFNLKPSKDPNNPVNDTRVAVFFGSRAYVFTLRPSNGDFINLKNEKVAAQLVTVSTGDAAIDQLGIRLWLGTDEKRLPLRLIIGNYQADLISETKNTPK